MKVLFLTRYGRVGASSRLRSFQYLPYLRGHGVETVVSSLIDDATLLEFYRTKARSLSKMLRATFRRAVDVWKHRDVDVVFVEKEAIPYLPHWLERGVRGAKPYVVDYDDAVFHNYDRHPNYWVRRLFGGKIASVMRGSAAVIVGNDYLASYATKAGARTIEYLPTVVDLSRYRIAAPRQRRFTIGWIGSPSTVKYLLELGPVFRTLAKEHHFTLMVVGSGSIRMTGVDLAIRDWSEETEAELIRGLDVGVMPLVDGPWEKGKCGYKLIQYMACGVPVVASPVGINREIVERGKCGYLADSSKDWLDAFRKLVAEPDHRRSMGASGRATVESQYSLEVAAPRLLGILARAAQTR